MYVCSRSFCFWMNGVLVRIIVRLEGKGSDGSTYSSKVFKDEGEGRM